MCFRIKPCAAPGLQITNLKPWFGISFASLSLWLRRKKETRNKFLFYLKLLDPNIWSHIEESPNKGDGRVWKILQEKEILRTFRHKIINSRYYLLALHLNEKIYLNEKISMVRRYWWFCLVVILHQLTLYFVLQVLHQVAFDLVREWSDKAEVSQECSCERGYLECHCSQSVKENKMPYC